MLVIFLALCIGGIIMYFVLGQVWKLQQDNRDALAAERWCVAKWGDRATIFLKPGSATSLPSFWCADNESVVRIPLG